MEWSEAKIIAAALLLGARQVPGWTMDEERPTHRLQMVEDVAVVYAPTNSTT
jgi:hypothetical protein